MTLPHIDFKYYTRDKKHTSRHTTNCPNTPQHTQRGDNETEREKVWESGRKGEGVEHRDRDRASWRFSFYKLTESDRHVNTNPSQHSHIHS